MRHSTRNVGVLWLLLWLGLPAWVAAQACSNATYNYQGYGATSGGQGQTVVTVTNLNDSGSGSLRNAVASNRCVQFSVSGTINLSSSLTLSGATNLTIDGLSAPSPGITLAHCGLYLQGTSTSQIIIRGLRIRMDSSSEGSCGTEGDGIQIIDGPHHLIIDRNSISGAVDENLGLAHYVPPGNAAHDITLSYNFFTDPTQIGPNRVNTMIAAGPQRVSFHHNLMAEGSRLPRVGYEDNTSSTSPDVMADVRNNLSYMAPGGEGSNYTAGAKANVINNYFVKASAMDESTYATRTIILEEPGRTQIHTSGNDGSPAVSGLNGRGNVGSPFSVGAATVTTTSALQGACDVVNQGGVFPRDSQDQNVLARFSLSGCPTGVNFTFTASSPVQSGMPSTLAWSQPTGATSCTASMVSGSDANWASTTNSQLLAGGSKSGVNLTSSVTYRMMCTNGITPLTIDRTVTIAAGGSGTVYWVNASGPGLISTPCSSIASTSVNSEPAQFRPTINSGIQCLGSGDTLVVKDGLYTEQVDLNTVPSGSTNFVPATRLVAQNPRQPRIVPPGGDECCGFVGTSNRNAWIVVEGFDVGGGVGSYTADDTPGGVLLPGPSGTQRVRFLNNKFHHLYGNAVHDYSDRNEYLGNEITVTGTRCTGGPCGGGGNAGHPFYINGVGHIIDGNYIHHCRDQDGGAVGWQCYAIHARFIDTIPTADWLVRNNRIEFAEEGILIVGSNMQVYNNVLTGITGNAIWNHAFGGSVYYFNTIVNNQGCAFYANTGASGISATATNNLVMGNGNNSLSTCLQAGSLNGTNNLIGGSPDALFVSPPGNDFHLKAEDRGGVTIAGISTDLEGRTRRSPDPDRGAYEFGGVTEPPAPDPFLTVGEYRFDEGTGTLAADSSANGHACTLNSAGWVLPGIIGPAALSANGTRWCEVTADSALRPANNFCLSGWFRSSTPQSCDLVSMGDSYAARLEPTGQLAGFYYDGTNWPMAHSSLTTMTDGSTHHWVVTKDVDGLRTWIDRAQGPLLPSVGAISYTLGPNLQIGRHGNGDTGYTCTGVIDQVYVMRGACTQTIVDNLYAQQVSVTGTSMTHSQFERANAAIGSILATDADLPTHDRTQAVALAVAIQRTGTTLPNQYFALECSRNGGASTALTNLFGTLGARIAPDSVLNMGDSVPVSLPTGGFTGVAGRAVANTINTSFTTTLATGQQTQWRYTLDFGGPAVAGDTYDCRPAGLDSYANVKRITLADPAVNLGIKGPTLRGLQLR